MKDHTHKRHQWAPPVMARDGNTMTWQRAIILRLKHLLYTERVDKKDFLIIRKALDTCVKGDLEQARRVRTALLKEDKSEH